MISVRILDIDLARAHRIARAISDGVDHDMRLSDTLSDVEGIRSSARKLADTFAQASDLARALNEARGANVLHCAHSLFCLLEETRSASFVLNLELESNWGHRRQDRDQVRMLDHMIAKANGHTVELLHEFGAVPMPWNEAISGEDGQSASTAPRPREPRRSAISSRLTDWAARMLPDADRAEYTEMFHSELHDLAVSGSDRRTQIAYSVRVLLRAPSLRRELRAPARERSW